MNGSIEMTPGRKEEHHVPVENSSDHTAKSEVPIVNTQSTNRYAKWLEDAAKRRSVKPFEERRIGWITPLPKEQVVCCGQSARDFWWITGGMVLFYAANALFCWLFSTITNTHFIGSAIAYGVIGLLFLLLLFTAVALKSRSIDHERLQQLGEDLDCALC